MYVGADWGGGAAERAGDERPNWLNMDTGVVGLLSLELGVGVWLILPRWLANADVEGAELWWW